MAIPEALATAPQTGGLPPEPAPTARGKRRGTPYLLLLPGMLWLALFFAVPILTMASTSLQTRVPGAEVGVYTQTFRFANYVDALMEYYPQFIRAFLYAGIATVLALLIGLPPRLCHRVQGRLVEELLAGPRHRAVLHELHPADDRLEAGAGRRGSGGQRAEVAARARSDRLAHRDKRCGRRWYHVQLPAVHDAASYASLERVDPRLVEVAGDLYANLVWRGFTFDNCATHVGRRMSARRQQRRRHDAVVRRLRHHELQPGNINTFPKFVYVSATRGIPPQANVVGTAMFVVALAAVLAGLALSERRRRLLARS